MTWGCALPVAVPPTESRRSKRESGETQSGGSRADLKGSTVLPTDALLLPANYYRNVADTAGEQIGLKKWGK